MFRLEHWRDLEGKMALDIHRARLESRLHQLVRLVAGAFRIMIS